MRDIKFRAWDKTRHEYLSGGQVLIAVMKGKQPSKNPIYLDILKDADMYKERFVLEQYTELHDKSGREIYEGDIIKFNNNKDDLCQVCFGEHPVYDMETEEVTDTSHGWYAKVIFTDELSKLEPFCYDRVINNQWIGTLDIEVIGNIHENQKLI